MPPGAAGYRASPWLVNVPRRSIFTRFMEMLRPDYGRQEFVTGEGFFIIDRVLFLFLCVWGNLIFVFLESNFSEKSRMINCVGKQLTDMNKRSPNVSSS